MAEIADRVNMAAPLTALTWVGDVGDVTSNVFQRAGILTVGDVYGANALGQPVQAALDNMRTEQPHRASHYWRALAARCDAVIARVRSASAPPIPPEPFACPITLDWLRDPVVSKHGKAYERSAILELIVANHGLDDEGRPLAMEELYPCPSLRMATNLFRANFLRISVPFKVSQ